MKSSYYSLGIDIGGTNTVFGAISNDGLILKKDSILTRSSEDPGQLFDKIFEKNKVWKKELNNRYLFKDIGIGVPNGNYFTGMVKDPPNLGQEWQNLDLVKFVKKYQDIPVKITNDANAAAMGEKSFGVAKETHPELYPLKEKIIAFGWECFEIDGHNPIEISNAISNRKTKKPLMIIGNTIKGKGISFMENRPLWHYRSPNPEEYKIALKELEKLDNKNEK